MLLPLVTFAFRLRSLLAQFPTLRSGRPFFSSLRQVRPSTRAINIARDVFFSRDGETEVRAVLGISESSAETFASAFLSLQRAPASRSLFRLALDVPHSDLR